jgi:acyl transferase domain-containing protein
MTPNDTRNGYSHEILEDEEKLEPIAVIGFSFRFPQDATSVEDFWKMLVEKRNAMTEWPQDRLHLESFYHPEIGRKETV